MLNGYEITMIQGILIAIDSETISKSYCEELVDYVRRKKNEAYKYLLWLLNRWVLLRLINITCLKE